MKKQLRRLLVVLFPFMIMVSFNEWQRVKMKSKGQYSYFGVTTINSNEMNADFCSWACHQQTKYCKEQHTKYLKQFLYFTDIPYYILINSLKNTGNYRMANLVFLVLVIPGLILFFTIRTLEMNDEINQIISNKKQN